MLFEELPSKKKWNHRGHRIFIIRKLGESLLFRWNENKIISRVILGKQKKEKTETKHEKL